MCNYVAFFPQKYGTFKNKMPCLKFTKFYYSHILVGKKPLYDWNMPYIYDFSQGHLTSFVSYIRISYKQLQWN
jgi:hypothetical protein